MPRALNGLKSLDINQDENGERSKNVAYIYEV
ncbi:hypothetical protein HELA111659_06385 [Helicobacter labetoulli]